MNQKHRITNLIGMCNPQPGRAIYTSLFTVSLEGADNTGAQM